MSDVLLTRAEALTNRLSALKFSVSSARADYALAVEDMERASASAGVAGVDQDVAQENTRHAEVLLGLQRKKLETACAFVEKELR